MGGIPHDHYEPKSKATKAINSRLPIIGLLYDTLMIPTPKKPELDVDLGHCLNLLPGHANCHRRCPGDALHTACRSGLRFD